MFCKCTLSITNAKLCISSIIKCTSSLFVLSTLILSQYLSYNLFKKLDYCKLYKNMIKPAYLFDGRNILDYNEINKIGFLYKSIGIKN